MLRRHIHPSLFLVLFLPFGVLSGFTNVTIAFLMTKAGVPLEISASFVAMGLAPNVLKFLWAPLVDTSLTLKKWYVLSNIITAVGIVLMTMITMDVSHGMIFIMLNLVVSFFNTFLAMSTEAIMAYDTPENLKGRAAGWLQAGNLGGLGLGGGAGLWIAERVSQAWISGAVIGAACLLCTAALIFFSEPEITIKEKSYIKSVKNLNKDLINLVKSKRGLLGLILCFMPVGTCAASNLWSAVSNDWKASADAVALVIGTLGGVFSIFGSLAGGWICDRMDKKRAYILFGIVQAVNAVVMAFSPHTEMWFIIWCSVYAFDSGMCYAGFSAFTLEAIGKGAAATKYNIFASLSNAPAYGLIYLEEWAHGKWGAMGMLNIEAIMALLGIITFITIFVAINKMRPAPDPEREVLV